jgi:hypothetical protein
MGYGCRKNLFSASNPNSGITADLCIVVLVRLERIMDAGVDFLLLPFYLHLLMSAALLDYKRPRKPTLRFGKTGSTIDVRLASYKCLRRGVGFSSLVDMVFAMEGP